MPLDSDLLAAGIEHHQAGRLEQAYEIYSQLLAAHPDNATALSLLGAVCVNLRRFNEAAGHLVRALKVDPNHQGAHDNLGVLLAKQGRMAEAVESFRRAAELNPHHAQTQLNLAAALDRLGRRGEAIDAYRLAAHLAPQSVRANSELAKALQEEGRAIEAAPYYRQVARLKRDDPRAYFELAAALAEAGQIGDAIAAYHETYNRKPDSAETCVNLVPLYIDKKEYDEAARWARRALDMRPRFAEAHFNLGAALVKLQKFEEASASFREAIRLKPELAQAYDSLGSVLVEGGHFDEAFEQYRQALALNPACAETYYNWGFGLLKRGDLPAAIEQFDLAIELKPNYGEAHHNRGAALLLQGRFEEGLVEYEWRFRSRDYPPFRPRWKTWEGDDASGRTLVLVAEQGLGDTLQFVRYANLLSARGARVIVECSAALNPLLAPTPGVAQWISPADAAPDADGCLAMMSMPLRLRTTLPTIPADVPYIFADPARVAAWRDKAADRRHFNVGIAWQGNPHCPGDRLRSIPLTHFEPLSKIPGVRLFSLQKGPGVEQLAGVAHSWGVVDFGADLDATGGAFMDTAAIIQHLDLVITSDTAVAHLAGALGARVWVALQFIPDWRWLLARDDSPWYPTMRLFRQGRHGDWRGVFARLTDELERLVAEPRV
jgi:tetratricopeptide (TPR) repeat protein